MLLKLTLLSIFALLSWTSAQDTGASAVPWPEWVTNDYTCVIGCLQTTFGPLSPPADVAQTDQAMSCVTSTCNQATAQGNAYQATYIIQMWNKYGTLYEPESWISNGGPLPTQQAVAVDVTTSADSATPSSQNDYPVPTASTGAGITDTAVYAGSNPTTVSTASVVNHGFTTSSISASASGIGAVNGTRKEVNGTGSGNGTDSGAGHTYVAGSLGSGMFVGLIAVVLGSLGGSLLLL